MIDALLNTVMGLTIVFAALIFISFCIYVLKYIPALLDFVASKFNKETTPEETEVRNISQESKTSVPERANKEDDKELIAVITAAVIQTISESTNQEVTADGLIIRKIKRK
ncbi:MAG: OadG family protein [Lachnoclostridium sp.]|jgi:sodium pump decarboxylase gamma subunit|nr:OadG family protein [Lachnoclostridium sp.]